MSESPLTNLRAQVDPAMLKPRVIIQDVAPCVDGGRYPAKATVNQAITCSATIFMDGHDRLAARLLYQESTGDRWRSRVMHPRGNDRWEAVLVPGHTGLCKFRIEAWFDQWATFYDEVAKKHRAGVPLQVELEEGRMLLLAARHSPRHHARPDRHDADYLSEVIQGEDEYSIEEASAIVAAALQDLQEAEESRDSGQKVRIMLDQQLFRAMEALEERRFCTGTRQNFSIDVERTRAGFASWYELFPRSVTNDPARHGTFEDVIGRLPAIAAMGFDVLYFPPIHPIGLTNRKGRNNAVQAREGEPGSPYAIGSPKGGHDAVLEELGGIEQFRRLRVAAEDFGLEIALDFAIQCSPDHPWLRDHPDWFSWRPDGTIRYAENPPKKYQDIVNVNFYSATALPDLWEALRDVVLYWISEGVKIFRVDNPHTKPLPFWEWLISQVRGDHPEVIFLSEAFTRPAMMYQLAKLGFNQSYTYFIWRNSKQELTDYLLELSSTEVRDYYRPNFFVNTPDINPYFLQSSGRPGFLIRAALATTLSGLWGMYSGFEVCESAALPGKEEYLDAEKYEIKVRDYSAPGNIVKEISRLNHIRKEHSALQTHLNVRFLESHNDQVIFYAKYTHDLDNLLLIAISLDPHQSQEAWLDVPSDLVGGGMGFPVRELIRGVSMHWAQGVQHWYFDPGELPFAIFQVIPRPS
ncbi:alpha-1,4-glucan--maltose-1-phosphate maltosyltransferase [Gilvimarinus sp. F26214L]|uniref:alpha-1,4-glucan--maltose-1-phosphate maltosyltransferase n=1 Tax=Gilvimarinus sp. DZF01 TaxID=3461371 RepID=UPI00404613CB